MNRASIFFREEGVVPNGAVFGVIDCDNDEAIGELEGKLDRVSNASTYACFGIVFAFVSNNDAIDDCFDGVLLITLGFCCERGFLL